LSAVRAAIVEIQAGPGGLKPRSPRRIGRHDPGAETALFSGGDESEHFIIRELVTLRLTKLYHKF
jgi:hypothetical protein